MGNSKKFISKRSLFTILVLGWSIIILFFTLSPKGPDSLPLIDIPHFDKVGHFGIFFILSMFLFLAASNITKKKTWLITICYCAFLGFLTEYLQTKIEGRTGDIMDFIADMLGGLCGALFISYINFQHRKEF
ncbi:MAG: VanZ family protein [Algoriphagus sp.]